MSQTSMSVRLHIIIASCGQQHHEFTYITFYLLNLSREMMIYSFRLLLSTLSKASLATSCLMVRIFHSKIFILKREGWQSLKTVERTMLSLLAADDVDGVCA